MNRQLNFFCSRHLFRIRNNTPYKVRFLTFDGDFFHINTVVEYMKSKAFYQEGWIKPNSMRIIYANTFSFYLEVYILLENKQYLLGKRVVNRNENYTIERNLVANKTLQQPTLYQISIK